MLKVGAVGSIFALRFALTRRNRDRDHDGAAQNPPATEAQPQPRRSAHPVSRKKKRRRRG
jgi:hypothetical protein